MLSFHQRRPVEREGGYEPMWTTSYGGGGEVGNQPDNHKRKHVRFGVRFVVRMGFRHSPFPPPIPRPQASGLQNICVSDVFLSQYDPDVWGSGAVSQNGRC